jgi:hypothetical protein
VQGDPIVDMTSNKRRTRSQGDDLKVGLHSTLAPGFFASRSSVGRVLSCTCVQFTTMPVSTKIVQVLVHEWQTLGTICCDHHCGMSPR